MFKAIPSLQHHVGGDDELNSGEVLNSEIVAEANKADDQAYEEAKHPLHEHVLIYVALLAAPPVLLEELVLQYPTPHTHTHT